MNRINYKAFNRLVILLSFLAVLALLQVLNLLGRLEQVLMALTPFYLAFIIIWIMKPLSVYLHEKRGMAERKANLLAILINLLVMLLVIFIVLPILIAQIWDITQNSTQIISSITDNVEKVTNYFKIKDIDVVREIQMKVEEYINIQSLQEIITNFDFGIITKSLKTIIGAVGNFTMFILNIIFGYVIAIYLSKDFDRFVEKSMNLLFKNRNEQNKKLFLEATQALSGYFKGLAIVCLFVATIVTIGAWILGVPSPLLFGIIAGLFNIIPYIGPVIGGVPLILVALSKGIPTAIFATIIVFGTQFIESQILQPRIMAENTDLHPITVIVGLIIFGSLFGIIGMIISTPTLAVIAVIIKNSKLDIKI